MGLFNKDRLAEIQANDISKKSHTVLLVDDEEANLRGWTRLFESRYNLLLAHNGQEALDLIRNNPPPEGIHLILSDQRMPHLTGVDLFKELLPILPHAIRIILTGYTDIDAVIQAINEGKVYRFITKPVNPNDLLLVVQRALEVYDMEHHNRHLLKNLQGLHAQLEQKVAERTEELRDALSIQEELSEQMRIRQEELKKAEQELAQQNNEMEEDLELAEEVQKTMFRDWKVPSFLKVNTLYHPHSHVSGDVYHLNTKPDNCFQVFLGDATGHGVSAALTTIMATVTLSEQNPSASPQMIFQNLNQTFLEKLPDTRFMSGIYVEVTPDGQLTALNAGHPSLIIVPKNGQELVVFKKRSMIFGVLQSDLLRYEPETYQLQPGDRILMITDGVIEIQDINRKMFGQSRLLEFLKSHQLSDLDILTQDLFQTLEKYAEGQPFQDDLTVVAIEYLSDS